MRKLIYILLILLLTSCHTIKNLEKDVIIQRDTVYKELYMRDSIYVKDSVFIKSGNDTVWVEKWHTKYLEKKVHDSIFIYRTDTCYQYREKIVEVKKTPGIMEFGLCAFVILLAILGIIIFIKMRR